MSETILRQIAKDITFVKERVIDIESELADLASDLEEVRPEYLEKLKKIEQQRGKVFENKEAFLKFLKHELWTQTRASKDPSEAQKEG